VPQACLEVLRERRLGILRVPFEVAEQIFEDDLAAQPLAEKT
jgi:hypothetical protein